jgi:exosortase A-associated hydrolase 2
MPHAFFLTGATAPLFTLYWPGAPSRAPVLLLPPLLEEMNRARRQLHDVAEALSARGLPVLLPDLTGTGDSGGDLAAVSWSTWQDDVRCARHWLAERHAKRPLLCALRGGALLLAEQQDCHQLAVAPITTGAQQLQHWLRLKKMAARMAGETLSDASLQAELDATGTEVAGYWLAPAFAASLQSVVLPMAAMPANPPRGLIEMTAGTEPSIAFQEAVRKGWQWQAVAGERCWDSVETVSNAALTAALVNTLSAWESVQ